MKVKLQLRGGAWCHVGRYDWHNACCAVHGRLTFSTRYYGVGFRCCFSPSFVIKRKVNNEI